MIEGTVEERLKDAERRLELIARMCREYCLKSKHFYHIECEARGYWTGET